jgi:hypothetical protein
VPTPASQWTATLFELHCENPASFLSGAPPPSVRGAMPPPEPHKYVFFDLPGAGWSYLQRYL